MTWSVMSILFFILKGALKILRGPRLSLVAISQTKVHYYVLRDPCVMRLPSLFSFLSLSRNISPQEKLDSRLLTHPFFHFNVDT